MHDNVVSHQLEIRGMTCSGCELRIEKRLHSTKGVIDVKASYVHEKGEVVYDANTVSLGSIISIIEKLGYTVIQEKKENKIRNFSQIALIVVIILGTYMLINHFGGFTFFAYFPQATEGMGYAAVFVIGLLTSVHCIGFQYDAKKGKSEASRIFGGYYEGKIYSHRHDLCCMCSKDRKGR